jgi:predicted small metal-binding protein
VNICAICGKFFLDLILTGISYLYEVIIIKKIFMKTLRCADIGFDCKAVVKANTDEEVLAQAAKHAKEVHGVTVTPEMAAQIKTKIKEEKEM